MVALSGGSARTRITKARIALSGRLVASAATANLSMKAKSITLTAICANLPTVQHLHQNTKRRIPAGKEIAAA